MSGDLRPFDDAAEWHRIAEERRRQLERLQQRWLYTAAARGVDAARRIAGRVRRLVESPRAFLLLLGRSLRAVPRRATAGRRERELRARLAALPPAAPGARAPSASDVTAVIVTASQPDRLAVLLAALDRVGLASVVVDNAGVDAVATVVAEHPRATRLRLAAPASYAVANEQGLALVTTPWALLLNDDVAPLEDAWFDRLRAAVAPGDGRPDAVAVGAVLVHGRRGWLGGAAIDLTVQHAGIAPVLDGPLVRPVHVGRGATPAPEAGARDMLAVTGACMLLDLAAARAVGGLHDGFDYGMEDVDLCLRLGAHGAVRVATDAVLLHEEGATRLRGDRRVRAARQTANRRLLDARHAPTLRARVVAAALGHGPTVDAVARPATPPAVAVAGGPVPASLASLPAITVLPARSSRGGTRPVLLVRTADHHRRHDDAPRPPVPVIGWPGTAADAATWSDDGLEACDLLVTTDGDPDGALAERAPTLPVHRLAADAAPDAVAALLHDVLRAPRWSVRTGAPGGRAASRWGDTPVAEALRRELRALGAVVRVAPRPAWGGDADRAADVALHLKGRGVAPAASGQRTLVWIISHPSEVAPGELDAADLVLAGSELLAAHLAARTTTPVHVLPQAADDRAFTPGPADPERASRVLFLGNTRSVARPAVMAAVRAGLPLTLVGAGWHRFVDPSLVASTGVPTADLSAWYRSADVVLNDHWDEMRRWGLVSNRVFEVLCCGGCVVSDDLPGLAALLDDAVPTYADADGLAATVTALLADPARRAALSARGRAAVLARHTWRHRARTLVDLVAGLPA